MSSVSVPAALRKPRWPLALAIVFALIGAGITYGWETQSGYYALWPDTAHSTARYLQVPGGHPAAPGTGFYFVDVHELQANLLEEEYFRHFVTGADLVPATEELVPGQSETQRVHVDLQAMATSQQIAQAVAERALHMHVGLAGVSVLVEGVTPRYPAAQAGVQPGAIVTAVNGHPVRTVGQLEKDTSSVKPGQVVTYTFSPGGRKAIRTVADPAQKSRAIIGIEIGQNVRVTHLPVHVKFLFHDIGGPSAGLAFTLDIYDSLSGRHLLRGHRIAVTGTISLDGQVGPIGAIKQKTIGAIDAGADTFLVPAGDNYRGAVAESHGRIKVISITSFQQALKAIRALPPKAPAT
ncbi:MAG: S16 family serine protease [Gaiellales bacterium]